MRCRIQAHLTRKGPWALSLLQAAPRLIFIFIASLVMIHFSPCLVLSSNQPTQSLNTQEISTILIGRVTKTSILPDVKTNPYPDCVILSKIEVLHVTKGVKIPRSIVVAAWGFRNRTSETAATWHPGTFLRLGLIPFSTADERIQNTQQADTIEDYGLELFWVVNSETIRYIERTEQHNTSVETFKQKKTNQNRYDNAYAYIEKIAMQRLAAIEADRKEIASALQKHGGDWDAWHHELEPLRADLVEKLKSAGGVLIKDDIFYTV